MEKLPYNPEFLTVVIIDDHDPMRKAIRRALAGFGFKNIIEHFDGIEIVKILGKVPIDLVICDIYMRKTSGFQVLKTIRSQKLGSDLPVIIISGEALKEDIVKAADLGADDYLLKPFQIQELDKKIKTVLTRYFSPPPILKVLRIGERALIQDKLNEALQAFDAAIKIDPKSPRALYDRAVTLQKMGRVNDALALLTSSAEQNKEFYKNYALMADIFIANKRLTDAIKALKMELELNPKQPKRQVLVAELLTQMEDHAGAIEHYRVALLENPRFKPALLGIGDTLEKMQNVDKAVYYYKRARRQYPTFTQPLEKIVECYTRLGELKKAELILRDEKRIHPDSLDVLPVLAQVYARMEQHATAIAILDELLTKDPENIPGIKMKGVIFMEMKDFNQAAEVFKILIQKAPVVAHYILYAEALLNQGKHAEAIQILLPALPTNPHNGRFIFLLAEAYKKSGAFGKAHYLYRRAIDLGQNQVACLAEAGACSQEIVQRRRVVQPVPRAS